MRPEDFYTKPAANEGRRMPLCLPDGTETDEWLLVLGIDSDAFNCALTHERRKAIDLADKDDDARECAAEERRINLRAVLVGGWSFDSECTSEAVKELLCNAPQLADQIDTFSADRAAYFKKKLTNLSTGPDQSSGSQNGKKTAPPSESTSNKSKKRPVKSRKS